MPRLPTPSPPVDGLRNLRSTLLDTGKVSAVELAEGLRFHAQSCSTRSDLNAFIYD